MSNRNLVPRALVPHLEAPRQVSHESQTGTRGSSGQQDCRSAVVRLSLSVRFGGLVTKVDTWLNLFKATIT